MTPTSDQRAEILEAAAGLVILIGMSATISPLSSDQVLAHAAALEAATEQVRLIWGQLHAVGLVHRAVELMKHNLDTMVLYRRCRELLTILLSRAVEVGAEAGLADECRRATARLG